jgi:WD40 repeat protein
MALTSFNRVRHVCLALLFSGFMIGAAGGAEFETEVRLGNLIGHTDEVVSVTFSPDGKWLLSSSWDTTTRLWDVSSGRELTQFSGFGASVFASAFVPNTMQVVSAGWDQSAHIWDISSGNELQRFKGHSAPINSLAIAPGGKTLATASGFVPPDVQTDQTIRIWSLANGANLATLSGHASSVVAVKFLRDDSTVVSASLDGTVRRWDVHKSHEQSKAAFPGSQIISLAVSPDGETIAAGFGEGVDKTIVVIDAASMSAIAKFGSHNGEALAYSPDGRVLASASNDGTIEIWDAKDRSLLRSHRDTLGRSSPRCLSFSPDGKDLVIGGTDGAMLEIDAVTFATVQSYGGRADVVSGLAVTPDGHWLATALGRRRAAIWDLTTGRQVRTFLPASESVRNVALSNDGTLLAAGSGVSPFETKTVTVEPVINVWSVISGKQVATLHGHLEAVTAVRFFADGKRLLTASYDGTVRIWDITSGKELRRYALPGEEFLDTDASANGNYVAASSKSNSAFVWDAESTKLIATFRGLESGSNGGGGTVLLRMGSLRFSSDGSRLLTGSDDDMVREWSLESQKEVRKFDMGRAVFSVCYSPDGEDVIAGGGSEDVHIFRNSSDLPDMRLIGHEAMVQSVASTQSKVISASGDATVRVWDPQTGNEVARLISFQGEAWAVIDKDGHFDEPNAGNSSDLYWVAGLHTIQLSQFKTRYYRPGLLARRFASTSIPASENQALKRVSLGPDIVRDEHNSDNSIIKIKVVDQGGGVGSVRVKINGKLVIDDARSDKRSSISQEITIKAETLLKWLNPGAPSIVTVQASNSDGSLLGEAKTFAMPAQKESPISSAPTLWVIAVGVSHYSGADGSFDLEYAANDARDVSKTLTLGGEALFGKGNVNVQLLSSDNPAGPHATKTNIQNAFAKLQDAKYHDIVVVYLSGHGLSFNDEYYFPTEEVNSLDISDPAVRLSRTISGNELALWLRTAARKQAIILDTCAAGALGHQLAKSRSISPDQVRALERMRDRAGLYLLMGSAADKESYEASPYERGLITQAVLDGMRGAITLKDDKFVSVAPLFDYAKEQVQELAQQVGGTQIPFVFAPDETSESFYIGSFDRRLRLEVPYHAKKPILLRPIVMDSDSLYDPLDLSSLLAATLREDSYEKLQGNAPYVYYDASNMAGGTLLNGLYRIAGKKVEIRFVMRNGSASRSSTVSCDFDIVSDCVKDAKKFVQEAISSFTPNH